jgi:hypothetical protein
MSVRGIVDSTGILCTKQRSTFKAADGQVHCPYKYSSSLRTIATMSWFTVPEALKDLKASVESVIPIPSIDRSMIEKLTLTSPELLEERRRIDEEEKHKEKVKDLISLMPWETRDPERDILVEECKEAILRLSSDTHVFCGPFHLPKPSVKLQAEEIGKISDEDGSTENDDQAPQVEPPTDEALEKLKTLEPLPPLLQNFELNAHVGLIQKLLRLDPKLVRMQSCLSGGGDHERIFWQNYFFHCAWCRYEAGLSIDEIWSDQPQTDSLATNVMGSETNEEETITFDASEDPETGKAFLSEPVTDADAPFHAGEGHKEGPSGTAGSDPRVALTAVENAGFELVGESEGADDETGLQGDVADYELDALEAEIARELED